MLIREITKGQYKIELSDEELLHFRTILLSSENMLVTDIPSLLNFILTWCEQRWYQTVQEPYHNGNPDPQ